MISKRKSRLDAYYKHWLQWDKPTSLATSQMHTKVPSPMQVLWALLKFKIVQTHSDGVFRIKNSTIVNQHLTILSDAPNSNSNESFLEKTWQNCKTWVKARDQKPIKIHKAFISADFRQTCSLAVCTALYKDLTEYPCRLEALVITTIRECHTSSFTKLPACKKYSLSPWEHIAYTRHTFR